MTNENKPKNLGNAKGGAGTTFEEAETTNRYERVSIAELEAKDEDKIEIFLQDQRKLPSGKKYRVFEMDHPVHGDIRAICNEKDWTTCLEEDKDGEPVFLTDEANVFKSGQYWIIGPKGKGAAYVV